MTNQIYIEILASSPYDLHQRILIKLAHHVGSNNRISKPDLVRYLFGKVSSTTDRQTRDAVADLQESGFPVLSDSGGGGYWVAGSNDEADSYLNEIDSRIRRLSAKRKGILQGLDHLYGPPALF